MASDSEHSPIARAVLIALAALALYVLSVGPVWRATASETGLPEWVITAYYPVAFTSDHCKPVQKALFWYVDLWLPPRSYHPSYYP